ncbi:MULTISPECIES: agmatinase [unclassified Chelatococcus]|uniref:agmatinase n=1 Tax=unclassified Chelatococcus TaxID=2638111 RepID=UPI001BCD3B51|nr:MULTISPECIES: agmatinase [unclassified Chelatococcus]CAH1662572.1 Guanidinopropionase [Hyphomicrobiales bacterium]MBS7741397.1 agmatinase [Chelatococcus sp. HY11]MBX3546121.1 agmatinase [Chelatococcus sp.]MCO5077230.1 agmatinase [Chelatococcus sp.]CAH1682637.1 Guanidinopropionase [Hyphomicrobiales bacterium]
MDRSNLERLRRKYADAHGGELFDPHFRKVADRIFDKSGTRTLPFAGIPTFLSLPHRAVDMAAPDFGDLQVALLGIPMDLGVTNRNGSRFGPRALRTIERIGPYNEALGCTPGAELRVADIGDVPFRSRYDLAACHADIEAYISAMVDAGVAPLSIGGDHSISYSILRAVGRERPVGMVHIDAHCDTGGLYDQTKFHHGGPFRNAVLDGVLDPERTIQIGIRGAAEYLWEFSTDSGMTVIHADEITSLGTDAIVAEARRIVGDGPVYLSFDIDSLDPAFAPGTGTPEIGGLTTREALAIIRGMKGLDIIGADVVEVAPQYDATTNTAHAGAQMLFEILSLMCFSPTVTGVPASESMTEAQALMGDPQPAE